MMRVKLLGAAYTIAAVCAAGAPRMLGAQASFEGVITMHMSAQGMDQDIAYASKGDNVRMDMSMGGGMQVFMIFNASKKMMDVILPAQMMYMERSMDNVAVPGTAGGKPPEVTWTGKKETIAGYECEHVTVTDASGTQSDACVAKGLGAFFSMAGGGGMMGGGRRGGGGQGAGWQNQLPAGAFPLKVTTGGNVVMEVTNIEKKSLDAALFTVPEGYQKMAMPGGGGR
jgi:hypothetical protein